MHQPNLKIQEKIPRTIRQTISYCPSRSHGENTSCHTLLGVPSASVNQSPEAYYGWANWTAI